MDGVKLSSLYGIYTSYGVLYGCIRFSEGFKNGYHITKAPRVLRGPAVSPRAAQFHGNCSASEAGYAAYAGMSGAPLYASEIARTLCLRCGAAYIHVYTYVYVQKYLYIYIYICIYIGMYLYIYIYIHIQLYTDRQTDIHTVIHGTVWISSMTAMRV